MRTLFVFIFFFLIAFASWAQVSNEPARKQILILQSFGGEHPWSQKVQEGFFRHFSKSSVDVGIKVENLDALTIFDKSYEELTLRYLKMKYPREPEIVVAVEEEALAFLKGNSKRLWPHAAIIFSGLSSFEPEMVAGLSSATGVLENHRYEDTLDIALRLHPKTKRFIFLLDNQPRGNRLEKIMMTLKSRYPKVDFIFLRPSLTGEWSLKGDNKTTVALALNPSLAISMGHFKQRWNVPLYSFWDSFLNTGIVGGRLLSGGEQGEMAAQLALSILKGASPANIPYLKSSSGEYAFDAYEMTAHRLVLDQLPKHSQLLNFPLGFLDRVDIGMILIFFISFLLFLSIVMALLLTRDRKRMLKKMQESRGRLHFLMENIPDLVIFRVNANYPQHILFFSDGIKRMSGYSQAEINELMKIIHPEDQVRVREEREKQILAGQALELEYRIVCMDRRVKYVREKSCVVHTADGILLDGILLDITQFKLLEKEKIQMQNQLFQSSRLASMGTLAAGVAHEINNPLAIVQGYFDILKKILDKRNLLDSKLREYFDNGNESLARITNIVGSLKLFAKTGSEQYGPVNLHKIIEETLKFCCPIFEKLNIKITSKLEAPFYIVHGNELKLQQVVMSLFNNAKDAIFESEQKLNGEIEISTLLYDGNLVLRMKDNGKGIPQDLISKAFDPFFTTKAPGKGVGLGLSIAHSIIELIGGTIHLQSVESKGTLVTITLPLSLTMAQSDHLKKILPSDRVRPVVRARCLIVDDEFGMRRVLKDYLESYGHSVIEAEDGLAALELFKAQGFDYLFIDNFMPRLNGVELIKKIHEFPHLSKAQCFFMTGGFSDESVDAQIEDFIHGRLSKPFKEHDLKVLLKMGDK